MNGLRSNGPWGFSLGTSRFPTDPGIVYENAVTLLPIVKIWITDPLIQMPAGQYGFRFRRAGSSQISGAPQAPMFARHRRGVTMPSLPTSTMLYWRIGTYSGFALHQVTIWRSLADLSKPCHMTITWGKKSWGSLILRPTF